MPVLKISHKYGRGKGLLFSRLVFTRLHIRLDLDTKIWIMKVSQKITSVMSHFSDQSTVPENQKEILH